MDKLCSDLKFTSHSHLHKIEIKYDKMLLYKELIKGEKVNNKI